MPGTLQDYAQAVHDVISTCRDAEQGFRGAAHAVNAPTMKEMFQQYSAQRAQFAVELQAAVKAMGFRATDPQGLGGMLHASWMSLKGLVTGHDVHGDSGGSGASRGLVFEDVSRGARQPRCRQRSLRLSRDSSRKCKRPTIASRICANPLAAAGSTEGCHAAGCSAAGVVAYERAPPGVIVPLKLT